jgi:hypothetical protein
MKLMKQSMGSKYIMAYYSISNYMILYNIIPYTILHYIKLYYITYYIIYYTIYILEDVQAKSTSLSASSTYLMGQNKCSSRI